MQHKVLVILSLLIPNIYFHVKKSRYAKSVYYFIAKSVIILIILIVFLVLASRYKLRVRENEVNIHLIAEEHYDRYMDQKEEYNNEMGQQSLECTN